MKLSGKAITTIRNNTELKTKLALAMKCSVYTIDRWIRDNSDDLTKAAALAVIREETGLTDSEILMDSEEVVRSVDSE